MVLKKRNRQQSQNSPEPDGDRVGKLSKTGADDAPASRSNILKLLDNVEATDKDTSTSTSTDDDQSTPTSGISKIAESSEATSMDSQDSGNVSPDAIFEAVAG